MIFTLTAAAGAFLVYMCIVACIHAVSWGILGGIAITIFILSTIMANIALCKWGTNT